MKINIGERHGPAEAPKVYMHGTGELCICDGDNATIIVPETKAEKPAKPFLVFSVDRHRHQERWNPETCVDLSGRSITITFD